MKVNKGEHNFLHGGKTRDRNGPVETKKNVGINYVAKETPDCGLIITSNKGSLIRRRKNILICFNVSKEIVNQMTQVEIISTTVIPGPSLFLSSFASTAFAVKKRISMLTVWK